jgi:hypothetical protein
MSTPEGPPPIPPPEDEPSPSVDAAPESPAPESIEGGRDEETEAKVVADSGELAIEETVRVEEVEDSPSAEPLAGILRQDGLREVKVIGQFTSKKDKKTYYKISGSDKPVPASMVVLENSPAYKYYSKGIVIERPPDGKIGRGGRRHFGGYADRGDGTYQFVYDNERIAERINVPKEILEMAAEKGISPEFLVRARDNEHAAEHLRGLGINWGKETPPAASRAGREVTAQELRSLAEDTGVEVTADYIEFAQAEAERGNIRPADYLASIGLDLELGRLNPPDPVIAIGEIGRRRRKNIGETIKQIEEEPEKVRRSLKRPGKLPLGAHKITFLGIGPGTAKRVLALRITRKAKRDMPKEIDQMQHRLEELKHLGVRNEIAQEEMEILPEKIKEKQDELGRAGLRWYITKYHRYHNYLDNLDESVKSHRKRLSRTERSKLFGESGATQRRNLAYRVFDARLSLEALKDLRVIDLDDPEFVHNHEAFKKLRKEFRKSTKTSRADTA